MQKSKKVQDGKLIKINAEVEERFGNVKIHGDFFIEPVEKLAEIRDIIEGLPRNFDRDRVLTQIEDIDAKLIGFSSEDVVDVLEKFRGEGDE